jgi:DNA-directed RNA polymerase subunit RPC12/RpoP
MKEAMLYEKLPNDRVQCYRCAHRCLIADEKQGICQVRQNQAGTLYTLVYGTVILCHQCGRLLIHRSDYSILENYVQAEGRCPNCGTPLAGVGMGNRNPHIT